MKNFSEIDPSLFIENDNYYKTSWIKRNFAYDYFYLFDQKTIYENRDIYIDRIKRLSEITNLIPLIISKLPEITNFKDIESFILNFDKIAEMMKADKLDELFGGKDAIFNLTEKIFSDLEDVENACNKAEDDVLNIIFANKHDAIYHYCKNYKVRNIGDIKNSIVEYRAVGAHPYGHQLNVPGIIKRSRQTRLSYSHASASNTFVIGGQRYAADGYISVENHVNNVKIYKECDVFNQCTEEYLKVYDAKNVMANIINILYRKNFDLSNSMSLVRHNNHSFFIHKNTDSSIFIYNEKELLE